MQTNERNRRKLTLATRRALSVARDYVSVETGAKCGSSSLSDIAICAHCSCDMVYPTNWEQAADGQWSVALRCPNCEIESTGVFSEELIASFDNFLDHGTDQLLSDLRALTQRNMQHDVETFISALQTDCIYPEDFGPTPH